MAHSSRFNIPSALAATALILVVGGAAAIAQDVNVTLNGNPLSLSPPPVTRAGRVFVPLRGVFEKLGASVVYADGQINAQGNGHQISLHIGSSEATVDGAGQQLDVAPFIIGASTYVPLRFVSQALGATVNYDAGNKIVALASGGGAPPETVTPQPGMRPPAPPPVRERPAPPPQSDIALRNVKPDRDSAVQSRRPTIEAQFGDIQADPNSVRVMLDGLDVTGAASRTPTGIVYNPPSDLQTMKHTVRVVGRDLDHRPFDRSWQFVSGASAPVNYINDLRPADDSIVSRSITVSGRTAPNSRVKVHVGSANGGNSVGLETNADGGGNFSSEVNIDAPPGARLGLDVDSTDPKTQASAHARRNLLVR